MPSGIRWPMLCGPSTDHRRATRLASVSGRGGPSGERRPRPETGSGGRARQGRCKPRPIDPLLAKPDRAGLPPATIENGAGRGRCGVVCGCPLGTVRDRCEWHGSGTADEDDVRRARKSRHQLDRRVRPYPGDTRLVGKGRRRPAAVGRWESKPPPRWPGDRGQEREGTGTCETGSWRESQDERTASMSVLTLTAQAVQGDRERVPGRGLRQLPLQTSERRQARPHGAATVPGRG